MGRSLGPAPLLLLAEGALMVQALTGLPAREAFWALVAGWLEEEDGGQSPEEARSEP